MAGPLGIYGGEDLVLFTFSHLGVVLTELVIQELAIDYTADTNSECHL